MAKEQYTLCLKAEENKNEKLMVSFYWYTKTSC